MDDTLSNQVAGALDFASLARMTDADLTNLFGVRDFYIYNVTSVIEAGSTQQGIFTIQTDSNFLWQHASYYATVDGATDPQTNDTRVIPNVLITIQDTSSGRQLSSSPVPLASQFGYGGEPYVLSTPRFFRANTQVTVTLQNLEESALTVNLDFIGTKFFKFAQTF